MEKTMKHYLIIFLLILCPFTIFATEAPEISMGKKVKISTGSGDLIINITGFATSEGEARVALVNSKESYNNDNNFRQKIVPIKGKKAQFLVKDIEFGEYAVKVFHDENSNGKLDTAMFGIPLEAYGFSNDARGRFGSPDYSEAAFKFRASGQKIFIKVK
jgi:uncharacterized protein (DUF2141 family)